MTEMVKSAFDGKYRLWKKIDVAEGEDRSSNWVCIGVYDYLLTLR